MIERIHGFLIIINWMVWFWVMAGCARILLIKVGIMEVKEK